LLWSLLLVSGSFVSAFAPTVAFQGQACRKASILPQQLHDVDFSSHSTPTTSDDVASTSQLTVQEAVKLFGKLAEKYIMLDATGGMCCYSGCSDCEYREPGGGYRMADQSASRPKWIPTYEHRQINDKQHTSKWSTTIYDSTQTNAVVVNKQQFVLALAGMSYAPILGGPSVAASTAASIDDTNAAEYLFDILAEGKEVLTKHRMSVRLKQLSGGNEGLVWPQFQQAVGVK
jgi:hypothetical protein